jgi:DNA polymerase III delta prime subunit
LQLWRTTRNKISPVLWAPVKQEIRRLIARLDLEHKRRTQGLPVAAVSQHMVFTGPPGVGKTEVARLIGEIFRALRVLRKGHLVETDRAGLVAGRLPATVEVIEVAAQGSRRRLFAATQDGKSGRVIRAEAAPRIAMSLKSATLFFLIDVLSLRLHASDLPDESFCKSLSSQAREDISACAKFGFDVW